eukprot:scaffold2682_cov344-Pavlova_lutheri.AAC.25
MDGSARSHASSPHSQACSMQAPTRVDVRCMLVLEAKNLLSIMFLPSQIGTRNCWLACEVLKLEVRFGQHTSFAIVRHEFISVLRT